MIKVKVNWILDNIQIVLMTLKRFKMVADLKSKELILFLSLMILDAGMMNMEIISMKKPLPLILLIIKCFVERSLLTNIIFIYIFE